MTILLMLLNLNLHAKESFVKVKLDCNSPLYFFTCSEIRYSLIKRNIYLPYNNLEIISKNKSHVKPR